MDTLTLVQSDFRLRIIAQQALHEQNEKVGLGMRLVHYSPGVRYSSDVHKNRRRLILHIHREDYNDGCCANSTCLHSSNSYLK